MDKPREGSSQGPATDRTNTPVVDPTDNVKALQEASNRRADDLRNKDKEISDLQHKHATEVAKLTSDCSKEVGKLREDYQEKLAHKEQGRLDSIRYGDREEAAKTTASVLMATQTLAKQVAETALTLAKQVADTAAAQETRYSTQNAETNKRLAALETASSEGRGKQQVVDPQMDKMMVLVEGMARNQAAGSGAQQATKDYTAWIFGAAGILIAAWALFK